MSNDRASLIRCMKYFLLSHVIPWHVYTGSLFSIPESRALRLLVALLFLFSALKLILCFHAILNESAHGMLLLKFFGDAILFTRLDVRNEIEDSLITEFASDVVISAD
ncbi:hypothetical protein AVEN_96961-1 [Araneus ventricosus]|uniref:Uncharacterized protein n=1 Tax=Araneus ventricosus TaxID=182803 RepID=A0A4Y2MM42_ARAVE|nr:hypothetical protein AVEN_96961-1 [Araneus ventricosus]